MFKKSIAFLVVLLMAIGLLSGCGGSQNKTTNNTVDKNTENTSNTPKVVKLVLPLPTSLDPQLWTWGTHHDRMGIFEGLTKLDKNFKPIPANAESWTHNSDYTVWTFKLRKDLKWSDGTPLNAHDYEYSIKRAIDPKTYAGSTGAFITNVPIKNAKEVMNGKASIDSLGVKAIDDYTLEITLSKPSTMLDTSVTESWALPVPKKVIDAKGKDWANPENIISNGPYKVKAFTTNVKLVLEKNPHYYGKVNLDEIDVLNIQNQMLPYKNNDINIASLAPADISMVQNDPTLSKEMKTYKTGIVYYMGMLPSENDILQKNVKVRQAIAMSIDKNLIAHDIMKDTVRPGKSLIPEIFAPWGNDIGLNYDPAKAKELMKEAGYPDGKGFPELTIFIAGPPSGRELAIADQIQKGTGIKVKLVNEEWAKFVTEYNKVQPKDVIGYFITGAGTPSASYTGYFSVWNVAKDLLDANAAKEYFNILNDKSIDPGKKNDMLTQFIEQRTTPEGKQYLSLLKEADNTTDINKQESLYKQAAILREQMATTIPIDWENGVKLVKPYIYGYDVGNPMLLGAPPLYYNDLYIK